MSRYGTEEEQIEAFKSWWNKNGTQLLSGILIIVIAVSGWKWWENNEYVSAANASTTFDALQMHSQAGSFSEVSREALKLMQEQPESPYAAAAALLYATFKYRSGEVAEAVNNLNWVTEKSTDQALKVTANLRLARIEIEQNKLEEATTRLSEMQTLDLNPVQQSNADYVLAMISLHSGDKTEAYKAFAKVVENDAAEKNLSSLAQIQMDDLAQAQEVK